MEELKNKKIIAFMLGIILLALYFYIRAYPNIVSDVFEGINFQMKFFIAYSIVRIISSILCVNIAKLLNRNKALWGILGFVLPPVILIIVSFLKVRKAEVQ